MKVNPTKTLMAFAFLSLCIFQATAQDRSPIQTPDNGVADEWIKTTAFTHASIQVSPDLLLHDATLLIKGNEIVAVGNEVSIPEGAEIIDLKGKFIFPSFIDLNSHYGVPKAKSGKRQPQPQLSSSKGFKSADNDAIHPEVNASVLFAPNKTTAENLRAAGFGLVLSSQQNGISRGSGVMVYLTDKRPVLSSQASMHYSFSKGNSKQDYPSSLMGSIALLRQHFTDFDWYRFHGSEADLSMEAVKRNHRLPMFFEARDYQEAIRAQKLAKESGRNFIIIGNGDSRKDIPGLKIYNSRLVIPLKNPTAVDLSDQYALENISLEQLQDWKYAKGNAAYLSNAGIPLCITYTGHKNAKAFFASLRSAIQFGLERETAIAALTTTPASWMKVDQKHGKLQAGYTANFFVASGDIFTEKATVLSHYIKGNAHPNQPLDLQAPHGSYLISTDTDTFNISISGQPIKAKLGKKGSDLKAAKLTWNQNGMSIHQGTWFFYGNTLGPTIHGHCIIDGVAQNWSSNIEFKSDENYASLKPKTMGKLPQKAYQYQTEAKDFLIKNCTVWTCDENGIVPHLDVLVRGGKIVEIGENLEAADVMVIDGTGMHLTPGLIDEHSHIAATRGINESAEAISAEVRIEDVINANDINIYRQVAGGTTTSHILHGSANPIGGQTALIKLKYGLEARDLLFDTDHRFIKFALGENVKQSNWGDHQVVRYPQTRMGVEQVFIDGFTRAREYAKLRAANKVAVDWELEALLEILDSKRFITCHSYQQGEINMLMHVADSFGFTVNTFTHILEGYKVADKMKEHGVAASTFSDWWAYKFEVNDAIPFNAAILNEQGVLTGINSDDRDMGRRLNQEAAKTVKYGGVSEEEALNMVTINPAKMLHIDNRVGSITIGKDADLVLWTGNPLSIYSKVQTTWIDGQVFFDVELDRQMREWIAAEKQRLIDEMLQDKGVKKPFKKQVTPEYHCDTIESH